MEDWILAKRKRNDCLTRVRKAKADFVKSELDDSKKFWKNIHNIIPSGKNSHKIIH